MGPIRNNDISRRQQHLLSPPHLNSFLYKTVGNPRLSHQHNALVLNKQVSQFQTSNIFSLPISKQTKLLTMFLSKAITAIIMAFSVATVTAQEFPISVDYNNTVFAGFDTYLVSYANSRLL